MGFPHKLCTFGIRTLTLMCTGRKSTIPSSIDDNSVDSPHVKAELTSFQYKVRVWLRVVCAQYLRLHVC